MGRARHFVEPIAIVRLVAVRTACIIDSQYHVFHEEPDDRHADIPNHAPRIADRRTLATLVDRRRTAAVSHEVAIPDWLSAFQPGQRMKGWNIGLEVSASLSIQEESLDFELGKWPGWHVAFQQRANLADDVPTQARLHLIIVVRCSGARLQPMLGIRHRHGSVTLWIELPQRPNRHG